MFVYIIQQGINGPVKIGCAVDPGARLSSLQSGNPDIVTILGVCKGGRAVERMLLTVFSAHRIHGEWFHPHDDILSLAERLPTWDEVVAGSDCPTVRSPADRAQTFREAGYTHQEIGDYMGFSRQRAQQLAPSAFVSRRGLRSTIPPLLEKGPNWLGENRPPIQEYVDSHPELFATTLLIDGDI